MSDLRSLIAKMDEIEAKATLSEAAAPSTLVPTHFHKNNLGGKIPLMMTEPGVFWWESTTPNNNMGGMPTKGIIPWTGNTENRSAWNPASVDGEIKDGKYIEYAEGETWKTAKAKGDQDKADAELLEMLKKLMTLIDQYTALKAKKGNKTDANQSSAETNRLAAANAKAGASNATANTTGGPNMGQINKEGFEFKSSIAQGLVESFGYRAYTTEAEATLGQKVAAGAAGYGAAKGAGKLLGKAIPGVGLAFGAADAYDRAKKGDYVGAGIAGLSGLTSLVPGIGTAATLGLDAANLARDYKRGEFDDKPAGGATTTPAGADPKIAQLQKVIGVSPDGKWGPASTAALQAWQQKNGLAADGKPGPQTYAKAGIKEGANMTQPQSVAEGIASLRDRLAMIENRQEEEQLDEYFMGEDGNFYTAEGEQVTDEGIIGNLVAGAKNFGRGLSGGGARTAAGKFMKKGASIPNKVGQAIKANPVKTALATTLAGATTGYAMGDKPGQDPSPTPPGPKPGPNPTPSPTPSPTPTPDKPADTPVAPDPAQVAADEAADKEMEALKAQIEEMLAKLSQSKNPEVVKGVEAAKAKWAQAGGATPATPAGIQGAGQGVNPVVAQMASGQGADPTLKVYKTS